MRSPCVRCGQLLHTGENRVTVSLTVDELASLFVGNPDDALKRRLLCAIGLLEPDVEALLAKAME
jgi:hypothetical protein